MRDRASVHKHENRILASIAATGFGLTAMCIGQKRGFIPYREARDRVATALRSLANWQPHHRGFFFHWVNIDTGERVLDSEISSVDTAILLCGVLTCKAHFQDEQIVRLASDISDRVEWTWLSPAIRTAAAARLDTRIRLSAHPWDLYSELMMLYLLGSGSLHVSTAGRIVEQLETNRVRF